MSDPLPWTEDETRRRTVVEAGGTVVVNLHKGTDEALKKWSREAGLLVKIERYSRSPFRNPFILGRDGDRDAVCEAFAVRLRQTPHLLEALPSLRGKVLGCWCYPERCHGLEIIKALDEREAG